MTEERPPSGEAGPPPEPTTERTPSWTRRAAKAAAGAAWEDLSDTSRRLVDTSRFRLKGAWSRRPPRVGMVAWGFLAAAALAGAFSLGAQTRLAGRLPTDLDWRAASALLERDAHAGDAVIAAPPWADRARAELPARLPVFGLARYAGEPLLGVRRVWLITLPGLPFASDAVAREVAKRASSDGGPQRIGALIVTRYDLAQPRRAIAFLPDWLGQASVKVGDRPCEREGASAFRCPGEPALRVARDVREVGLGPRPCISAAPGSPATGPVTITFPPVPMGLELRGAAGFVGRIPSGATAPVRVAVQIDGAEVGGLELHPGTNDLSRLEVHTGSIAAAPHALSVVLSSSDPGDRTVCFDLWTQP